MLKSRKDEKDETKLLPKGNRNNARRGHQKTSIRKACKRFIILSTSLDFK